MSNREDKGIVSAFVRFIRLCGRTHDFCCSLLGLKLCLLGCFFSGLTRLLLLLCALLELILGRAFGWLAVRSSVEISWRGMDGWV